MTFDRIFRGDFAESQVSENTISGWLPGTITHIEPVASGEGLGRIRCKCDLLSGTTDLPNAWDGYVWVMEDFVNNGKPGGSHKALQVGTQVALVAMMGDPTQLLMIGCIHSREDRPDPIFDRANGVHGKRSDGDSYTIHNELEGSRVDAYPTGVTTSATKDGGVLQQTAGGARSHLQLDGTVSIENPKASTVHKPDGTVTSRSDGGAISILQADGGVKVFSEKFGSELNLSALGSELLGAVSPLTGLLKSVSKLAGPIGQASTLLGKLNGIGKLVGADLDANAFIKNAEKILGDVSTSLGSSIGPLVEGLGKINQSSVADIGALLLPQVTAAIGVDVAGLKKTIEATLSQGIPKLNQTFTDLGLNVIPDADLRTVEKLSYSTAQQTEFILSIASPATSVATANLSLLGLTDSIGDVQKWANDLVDPNTKSQDLSTLQALIPKELRTFIPDIKQSDSSNDVLTTLMGSISKGLLNQSAQSLKGIQPIVAALPQIQSLARAVAMGDTGAIAKAVGSIEALPELKFLGELDLKNPQAMIGNILSKLSKSIAPQIDKALNDFTKIAHAIPAIGPRAKVEVTDNLAKLSGALGINSLFAGETGVGAMSPWGGFGFGAGGGLFSAAAQMAIKAIGPGGVSSLTLDPKEGITLAGKAIGEALPSIQLKQQGDTIHIGSPLEGALDGLRVSPRGVEIDGVNLSLIFDRLLYLENEVRLLKASLPVV